MSKNKRRVEITAFRRQRVAITGATQEPPVQAATTDVDEDLAEAIRALVKQLTATRPGAATIRVSQKHISKRDDNDDDAL